MSGEWYFDDEQSWCYFGGGEHSVQDKFNREVTRPDFADIWMNDTNQHTSTLQTAWPVSSTLGGPFSVSDLVQNIGSDHDPQEQSNAVLATSNNIENTNTALNSLILSNFTNRKRSFDEQLQGNSYGLPIELITETKPTPKRINIDRTFTAKSPLSNLTMGFNTSLSRSRMDNYIHALRQLIKCANEVSSLGGNLKRTITAEGVLWVVREAWPSAEGYWNLTSTFRGFLAAELWRNFPCEKTYRSLPPEYRPTRAQLMIPHSAMVDWMPWPDIRDLAIRYQDIIDTDELFRMAILNVVAHRKKTRRFSDTAVDHTGTKSFRVWDLACLERNNGTDPLADPGLLRKPSLHSPSARALVRAFDLEYDQFSTQKLDKSFFQAFPELYCDTAFSSWQVENSANIPQEDVGYPTDLTRPAVMRLKAKIEKLIGTPIEV